MFQNLRTVPRARRNSRAVADFPFPNRLQRWTSWYTLTDTTLWCLVTIVYRFYQIDISFLSSLRRIPARSPEDRYSKIRDTEPGHRHPKGSTERFPATDQCNYEDQHGKRQLHRNLQMVHVGHQHRKEPDAG